MHVYMRYYPHIIQSMSVRVVGVVLCGSELLWASSRPQSPLGVKPVASDALRPPPPRNEAPQAQMVCARSTGRDGARGGAVVSCCGGVC